MAMGWWQEEWIHDESMDILESIAKSIINMGDEDERKRKRGNGGGQRRVRGLHVACLFFFGMVHSIP